MNESVTPLRSARRPAHQPCQHHPRCPDGLAVDRTAAKTVVSHPEQGWSLLCNGVVLFDDGGALLPGGRASFPHAPHPQPSNLTPAAAA